MEEEKKETAKRVREKKERKRTKERKQVNRKDTSIQITTLREKNVKWIK